MGIYNNGTVSNRCIYLHITLITKILHKKYSINTNIVLIFQKSIKCKRNVRRHSYRYPNDVNYKIDQIEKLCNNV